MCSMCTFYCDSQQDLINHLIRRHKHDKKFLIHCSGYSCGASFNKLKSSKSHVLRKHSVDADTVGSYETGVDDVAANSVELNASGTSDDDIIKSDAAYLLNLKAGHRLRQTALNDIILCTRELFKERFAVFVAKVKQHVKSGTDVTDEEMQRLCDVSIFEGLETEYKQERFFVEHFGYVPPAHVALGRRVTYCKRYGRYRTVQLDAYGYYVPFLQQLAALLCMP